MKSSEWDAGVLEQFKDEYDFARCQRPDGTFYGTGGQCRKGTPAGAKEKNAKKAKAKPATGEDAMRARFKESKKELGEGAYGAVKETAKGNVIKKGYIGPEEVEIMKALADVEGTPKLIDHAYTSAPFADRNNDRMGMIEMSKMKGKPLIEVEDNFSPKQAQLASEEYIRLRRDMHTRGVEHRDMHEMNFFFDPATNKGGVLDFGLSRRSAKGALEEALETGRDVRGQFLFGPLIDKGGSGPRYARFKKNRIVVNKELRSRGYDPTKVLKNMEPKEAKEFLAKLYDGV